MIGRNRTYSDIVRDLRTEIVDLKATVENMAQDYTNLLEKYLKQEDVLNEDLIYRGIVKANFPKENEDELQSNNKGAHSPSSHVCPHCSTHFETGC